MKNTDELRVHVTNSQTIDGEIDVVSEDGRGSVREKNGIYYIIYKTKSTAVMIKTDGNYVDLKRTGEVSSQMYFEKGKHTGFDYNTMYGVIKMDIFTRSLVCRLTSEGGTLRIEYVLENGGDKIYNDIMIRIER